MSTNSFSTGIDFARGSDSTCYLVTENLPSGYATRPFFALYVDKSGDVGSFQLHPSVAGMYGLAPADCMVVAIFSTAFPRTMICLDSPLPALPTLTSFMTNFFFGA